MYFMYVCMNEIECKSLGSHTVPLYIVEYQLQPQLCYRLIQIHQLQQTVYKTSDVSQCKRTSLFLGTQADSNRYQVINSCDASIVYTDVIKSLDLWVLAGNCGQAYM